MKAYFIDFENVKSKGLTGIDELSADDKVVIFYSENSDTITFEMHQKVIASKVEIEYLKVKVGGKNALDFQLCSLLGFMVAKDIYSHIFIVSNDKGFEKLHDFWCNNVDENKCVVFRTQTILCGINFAKAAQTIETPKKVQADLQVIEDKENIVSSDESAEESSSPVVEDTPNENTAETSEVAANESVAAVATIVEDVALPIEILTEEHELAWEMPADETDYKPIMPEVIIKKIPQRKGRRPKSVAAQIKSSLLGLFDFTDDDILAIQQHILTSVSKEDFHNLLAKTFKQHGGELYKVLRPKYLRLREALLLEDPKPTVDEDEKVEAAEPIPEADAIEEVVPEISMLSVFAEIERLLNDICTNDEINVVCELLEKTDTKQRLYLSMVKEFRKERGCEIYKLIKPEYSELEKLKGSAV